MKDLLLRAPVVVNGTSNMKIFTWSFGRLRQNIAPKSVPHMQHDYFSSFNQSHHYFVALSLTLPSSNLKLPIMDTLLVSLFIPHRFLAAVSFIVCFLSIWTLHTFKMELLLLLCLQNKRCMHNEVGTWKEILPKRFDKNENFIKCNQDLHGCSLQTASLLLINICKTKLIIMVSVNCSKVLRKNAYFITVEQKPPRVFCAHRLPMNTCLSQLQNLITEPTSYL